MSELIKGVQLSEKMCLGIPNRKIMLSQTMLADSSAGSFKGYHFDPLRTTFIAARIQMLALDGGLIGLMRSKAQM